MRKRQILLGLFAGLAALGLASCGSKDKPADNINENNNNTTNNENKHTHTIVVDEKVDPTCTQKGLTQGSHCQVCNEVIVAQKEIQALGHTPVTDYGVAATCTATGLTYGTHCQVCNEVIIAPEEIQALGHTPVTDSAVSATCTETGLTEGSHCLVCNEVITAQEEVSALGHTPVIDSEVAATCTEDGLTEGSHCEVCNSVLVAQTTLQAYGHTPVVDTKVDSTCTVNGLTEGSHCEECGEVLIEQKEIIASHTIVADEPVAPTCTKTGLAEGSHCSICNEVIVPQTVIPASGHSICYLGHCSKCYINDPNLKVTSTVLTSGFQKITFSPIETETVYYVPVQVPIAHDVIFNISGQKNIKVYDISGTLLASGAYSSDTVCKTTIVNEMLYYVITMNPHSDTKSGNVQYFNHNNDAKGVCMTCGASSIANTAIVDNSTTTQALMDIKYFKFVAVGKKTEIKFYDLNGFKLTDNIPTVVSVVDDDFNEMAVNGNIITTEKDKTYYIKLNSPATSYFTLTHVHEYDYKGTCTICSSTTSVLNTSPSTGTVSVNTSTTGEKTYYYKERIPVIHEVSFPNVSHIDKIKLISIYDSEGNLIVEESDYTKLTNIKITTTSENELYYIVAVLHQTTSVIGISIRLAYSSHNYDYKGECVSCGSKMLSVFLQELEVGTKVLVAQGAVEDTHAKFTATSENMKLDFVGVTSKETSLEKLVSKLELYDSEGNLISSGTNTFELTIGQTYWAVVKSSINCNMTLVEVTE